MSKRRTDTRHEQIIENHAPLDGADLAEIVELAYQRWVKKGCPQGTAEEDWLAAEKELRSRGAAIQQAG